MQQLNTSLSRKLKIEQRIKLKQVFIVLSRLLDDINYSETLLKIDTATHLCSVQQSHFLSAL